MAQDLRYFLYTPSFKIKSCPTYQQGSLGSDLERRNTLAGSLGKIGDLSLWNLAGAGKIGAALRNIASISNAVRGGNGAQPTIIGSGADWILTQLGLNSGALNFAKDFHPEAANQAVSTAQMIYEKMSQGKFKFEDIPFALQDFQNLEQLVTNIFTQSSSGAGHTFEKCGATPYAMDLIRYAPKHKFLFVVQFEFTEPYSDMNKNDMAFVVQTATMPNIQFEYDDVNMYNFHTQVIKKVTFNPMSMTFLDDDRNQATLFYTNYLKAYSPIANMHFSQKIHNHNVYEESGMQYGNTHGQIYPGPISTNAYSASRGLLNGDQKNMIKQITLFHIYRQGRLMNIHKFYNPKMTTMNADDLDMSDGGTPAKVNLEFMYDGYFVIPGYQIDPSVNKEYNITDLTDKGEFAYGLKYNGGGNAPYTKDDNSVSGQELLKGTNNPISSSKYNSNDNNIPTIYPSGNSLQLPGNVGGNSMSSQSWDNIVGQYGTTPITGNTNNLYSVKENSGDNIGSYVNRIKDKVQAQHELSNAQRRNEIYDIDNSSSRNSVLDSLTRMNGFTPASDLD